MTQTMVAGSNDLHPDSDANNPDADANNADADADADADAFDDGVWFQ